MAKYVIKRLLIAVLILFGISILIYFLIRLMPVNYIVDKVTTQMSNNGGISEEELQRLLALYGLDDDSFLGILKGYWGWLTGFLKGDMGTSFQYNIKVETIIKDRMGISFGISFVSLIIE
ncbi:MAG: diguanylate cyclase, partial [Clostridia bacterium]|nr:diguanylate cyclase [Clostridia bacterium]